MIDLKSVFFLQNLVLVNMKSPISEARAQITDLMTAVRGDERAKIRSESVLTMQSTMGGQLSEVLDGTAKLLGDDETYLLIPRSIFEVK